MRSFPLNFPKQPQSQVGVHSSILSCLLIILCPFSRKRACALVWEHVRGTALSPPGPANLREPLWEPSSSIRPLMKLGCGWEELIQGWEPGFASKSKMMEAVPPSIPGASIRSGSVGESTGSGSGWLDVQPNVQPLLDLYSEEEHLLTWHHGEARVALKDGAGPRAVLRALWQVRTPRCEKCFDGFIY